MPANPQVLTLLEHYTPTALGPDAWTLAREAVIDLAARTAPTSPDRARQSAHALCQLLSGPCGWKQTTRPDLAALLLPHVVNEVCAHLAATGRNTRHLAARLHAAGRVARGLPATDPAPIPRPATWTNDTSLIARARTLRATGSLPTAHALTRLAADLAAGGTAQGRAARTVEATYTARIRQAPDQRSTEAIQATPTPTPKPAAPARTSLRAERAARKAERDAARRAATGPHPAPAPEQGTLPDDVRAALADYRPRGVPAHLWAELRPLTLRLVAGTRPESVNVARSRATATYQLLQWLRVQPLRPTPTAPLEAADVLVPDVVDHYITHLRASTTRTDAGLRSTRSTLRHVVAHLDASAPATTYPATALRGPLSPEECQALVELVSLQPTDARRRTGSLIVGLALGAGLAAADLRHVRAIDITEHAPNTFEPYLTVTVPAGPTPRTVIVRDTYAPLVRDGLDLHTAAPTDLLIGRLEGRRNITTLRMTTAAGAPVRLDIARMRTTWLFAMIHAPIPLPRLLADAGLKTAATLADLLTYVPDLDPVAVFDEVVRALPDAPLATATATTTAGAGPTGVAGAEGQVRS